VNAGQCSFPDAWPGTTVCASFDRQEWFRCVDTTYDKATGHLDWTFDADSHPGESNEDIDGVAVEVISRSRFAELCLMMHRCCKNDMLLKLKNVAESIGAFE